MFAKLCFVAVVATCSPLLLLWRLFPVKDIAGALNPYEIRGAAFRRS